MSEDAGFPSAEVLARRVISELAPEEGAAFDIVAMPYLERPKEAERRILRAKDDPLGFGGSGVVELLTPVAALVCSGVVSHLAQEITGVIAGSSGRLLDRLMGRLPWRRTRPENSPLSWDPQRLIVIRAIACEQAERLGRTPRQAEELADAVISALVTEQG